MKVSVGLWLLPFLIWSASVIGKSLDSSFADYLRDAGFFPKGSVSLTVRSLAVAEGVTALALLWPKGRRVGWFLTVGLASAFLLIHGLSLAVGDTLPCGCFGLWVHFDARWSHALMGLLCLSLIACSWLGVMGATQLSPKSEKVE